MAKKKDKNLQNGQVDKELKKIFDRQEQQDLLFKSNELLPKKNFDIELEQHQLRSGLKFTIKEIKDLVKSQAREYEAMFPNTNPFFKRMYKLRKWDKLDPNSFIKPPVVALDIKRYIYSRYGSDAVPTLLAIENPILSGHIKKFKLFQFFTDEGIEMLAGIIQDANDVMNVSKDWYDFELKYTKLYNLPVQLKLLKD
ncbi:P63C domain-containing protein [Mucilaginibacter gilvus]|uniref:Bacteriophage Mx8 p63 C-terminal domain-containing protein n=1 Tax=Mucilaginibacter gilvus TaxID=2305909 RepID=A0A444MVB3_9SPHI|nr:P63C domain-containing protein [Mucilaginibacter gilvus]RWY57538.1 hypothetical protein EPL05_03135 [Mucilaginibacter gilvus]